MNLKDPYLMLLIQAANKGGANSSLQVEVMLLVNGFVVSGVVASYDEYMKHHPIMETIGGAFEQLAQPDPGADAPDGTPDFIHLRDAQCFGGPTPIPNNIKVWMRIPLQAVQGFSFGSLFAGPAP